MCASVVRPCYYVTLIEIRGNERKNEANLNKQLIKVILCRPLLAYQASLTIICHFPTFSVIINIFFRKISSIIYLRSLVYACVPEQIEHIKQSFYIIIFHQQYRAYYLLLSQSLLLQVIRTQYMPWTMKIRKIINVLCSRTNKLFVNKK